MAADGKVTVNLDMPLTRLADRRNIVGLAAATVLTGTILLAAVVNPRALPLLAPWLPVLFTVAIAAAVVSAYVLGSVGRLHGHRALAWVGAGNAAAAVVMTVQLVGFNSVAAGGGLLQTTGSGAALLYIVWHLAVPASIILGLYDAPLWLRWSFVGFVAMAAVAVAASDLDAFPELIDAGGMYRDHLEWILGGLTLLTLAALMAWYRRVGIQPLGIEAFVGVSILLCAVDVGLNTFAEQPFTALWWTSFGARVGQFLVLAVGLLRHLSSLQGQFGSYVEEAEARSRQSQLEAHTDPLTGLLNRRGTTSAALDDLRPRSPAAVIFIDLDRFKVVNDALGHEAGDRLLQSVARALTSRTRDSDVVGRWGGDEFVVVMPSTTEAVARRIADRVAESIQTITAASVGLNTFEWRESASFDAVLAEADRQMYIAKRDRRRTTVQN